MSCNLAGLKFAVQRFVVRIGQQLANGLKAGAPMGVADGLLRLETVFDGPRIPDACNRRGRVDQYTIKVKKQRTCGHDHTVMIPYRGKEPREWQEGC